MARPSLLAPLLAGGSSRGRIAACPAAAIGIALTALTTRLLLGPTAVPAVVAPMGASAVLLFAVPASPLAQPWPVVGGNVLSALVGVAVARLLGTGPLAAGVAVGLAIAAMSVARCLHPPGGAAALTSVIGGPAVTGAGFAFALAPVGVNALLLLASGWLFHRICGHGYPHRPATPVPGLHRDDIARALAESGEAFDIAPGDLEALLTRAEAFSRRRAAPGSRGSA
jgi:CBS domain-containing membrane protein